MIERVMVEWPRLSFPPINLWVLGGAAAAQSDSAAPRPQRPGMTVRHADALHNFGREEMQRILAMHGGRG